MKKIILENGILQYQFDADPGKHFGFNIIAVISGDRAVLIDTAFEDKASEVLKDMNSDGIVIEGIIISHYHGDHFYGLKALPRVPVYGSSEYFKTLDLYYNDEDNEYCTPTIKVSEPMTFNFGEHVMKLIPFPGHSECTILVNVDDKFFYIADELMYSNEGRHILPSISLTGVKRHIDSLNRLKDYSNYSLIPSHGNAVTGESRIRKDTDCRIKYLSAISGNESKIPYEEAVKDCDCTFLHSEWHENVYR